MRVLLSILCVLALLVPHGNADDAAANKERLVSDTADQVLALAESEDATKLKAVAQADSPDPWLVVEALCARGKTEAASQYAKLVPGKQRAGLAAYARRPNASAQAQRGMEVLPSVLEAHEAGSFAQAVETATRSTIPTTSISGVRIARIHGQSLGALRRFAEAAAVLQDAAVAAEDLGWLRQAALIFYDAGMASIRGGDYRFAQANWEQQLRLTEATEDHANATIALGNLGTLHGSRGDQRTALRYQERAIVLLEKQANLGALATLLSNVAGTYAHLGQVDRALDALTRALAIHEERGDKTGIDRVIGNLGAVYVQVGDYVNARHQMERLWKNAKDRSDESAQAWAIQSLASIHCSLGNFPRGVRMGRRAVQIYESLKDRKGLCIAHANLGTTYFALSNFPAALEHMDRSLAISDALGDAGTAASVLGKSGAVYVAIGEPKRALAKQQRAIELLDKLGDVDGALELRVQVAHTLTTLGEASRAVEVLEETLDLARKHKSKYVEAKALVHLGRAKVEQGDIQEALTHFEDARPLWEALGNRAESVNLRLDKGRAEALLGATDKAVATLEQVTRSARRLRATGVGVEAHMALARLHYEAKDADRALDHARRGLESLETILGGLDEGGAATARRPYARLYEVGTLAAADLDLPADALTFMESGRAGALLESLETRQSHRWAELPEALRDAEASARAAESRARRAYVAALEEGKRKAIRAASKVLDAARDHVRELAARVQREAKKQAGLFYPRAATLEEIQDALQDGEALIVYGLCGRQALAFLLTSNDVRIVRLGTSDEIRSACEALMLQRPDTDPTKARAALQAKLVTPLALDESVQTVLVSPEGPLCYVPFGALFDRPVAIAASGTTHVFLRESDRETGRRILSVGDPDYAGTSEGSAAVYHRGRSLVRLPASRSEVEQIGTVRLLGARATESALVETVKTNKRWRALHFACHGLIDRERPTLSALALTAQGESDGFLTALEILRLDLPTDLAVLSACETGIGKVVKGEGIVGLTRAFMYAGAPRVLCSLWKVDDEATRALMIKFYALWHPKDGTPGVGASEALSKAQAFIRSHEKWQHPYYWAAWVLWGLPN